VHKRAPQRPRARFSEQKVHAAVTEISQISFADLTTAFAALVAHRAAVML